MDTRDSFDYHSFIRGRRSVRRFSPRPVPVEAILRILETATWAPSAHNRQPWRFGLLNSPEFRSQVAEAMGEEFYQALSLEGLEPAEAQARVDKSKQRITDAPVAVILFMDRSELDRYRDEVRDRGETTMALQSTALAGGYLLLAAAAEGLGGVWVCAPLFTPQAIRAALRLPDAWEPQAMLLLGYPAGEPPDRSRRRLEEVLKIF